MTQVFAIGPNKSMTADWAARAKDPRITSERQLLSAEKAILALRGVSSAHILLVNEHRWPELVDWTTKRQLWEILMVIGKTGELEIENVYY